MTLYGWDYMKKWRWHHRHKRLSSSTDWRTNRFLVLTFKKEQSLCTSAVSIKIDAIKCFFSRKNWFVFVCPWLDTNTLILTQIPRRRLCSVYLSPCWVVKTVLQVLKNTWPSVSFPVQQSDESSSWELSPARGLFQTVVEKLALFIGCAWQISVFCWVSWQDVQTHINP